MRTEDEQGTPTATEPGIEDEPASPDLPGVEEVDGDGFPSVDDLIGSFFSEASLWPVLLVMLASAGAFGAALLILAGVDRNPFAIAALLLIVGMTLDTLIRARRIEGLRNVARLVGLIWGAAGALALLAIWTGIAG